jgi:hypothetical protein
LYGRGGDDTFHIGPQRSYIVGGNGKDTFIIPSTGGHTTIDTTSDDDVPDIVIFDLSYDQIKAHVKGDDLHLIYLDTHSVVVKKWALDKDHRKIHFFARPGILFDVDVLEKTLVPVLATFASDNTSVVFSANQPLYEDLQPIQGKNEISKDAPIKLHFSKNLILVF